MPLIDIMASGAGMGAVASHRGVDLGPHRSPLLRRIGADLPLASLPVHPLLPLDIHRSRLAATSVPVDVVRYGSGARFNSRERDRGSRRAQRFDSSTTSAQPAGPETAKDWLAALNTFSQRIDTLENAARDHAQYIGRTDERLIENH